MKFKNRKKPRKKAGLPPGSPVFTGSNKVPSQTIQYYAYNENYCKASSTEDNYEENKTDNKLWVAIIGLHETDKIKRLCEKYKIHPLAHEDILNIGQRPKMDSYENGDFISLYGASFIDNELELEQMSLFFNKTTVLSFQEENMGEFEDIKTRLIDNIGKIRRMSPDFLVYSLLDGVVDNYFEVIDAIELKINETENKIFTNQKINLKEEIFGMRNTLMEFRRVVLPLRDSLFKFNKSEHFNEDNLLYIKDLQDHIAQIVDSIENLREVLSDIMALSFSESSIRMNEVIKVLTVISTIFMPLSFLVGVYGMNFKFQPEYDITWAYPALWVIMIILTLGMLSYFRWKKWL